MAKAEIKMPEDFLKRLSKLGDKTDDITEKVLNAGGEVVLAKVKSNLSSMAEGESTSISENNKWSIQRRFKNGTFKLSYPPYSYFYLPLFDYKHVFVKVKQSFFPHGGQLPAQSTAIALKIAGHFRTAQGNCNIFTPLMLSLQR